MISYEIHAGVPPELEAEIRGMVEESHAYDFDAGFSHIDLDKPTEGDRRDVLIWLIPDDDPGRRVRHEPLLAAYLRLDIANDGVAVGEYVVRPQSRSHGVTTQFAELVGLDVTSEGGWLSHGITEIWVKAQGNHPATRRFARRFASQGITRTSEAWQLIAPLDEDGRWRNLLGLAPATVDETPAAIGLLTGRDELAVKPDDRVLVTRPAGGGAPTAAAWLSHDDEETTEYGNATVLRAHVCQGADARSVEDMLRSVLALERGRGAAALVLQADAENRDFVASCRRIGFHHDRTDAMYAVRA